MASRAGGAPWAVRVVPTVLVFGFGAGLFPRGWLFVAVATVGWPLLPCDKPMWARASDGWWGERSSERRTFLIGAFVGWGRPSVRQPKTRARSVRTAGLSLIVSATSSKHTQSCLPSPGRRLADLPVSIDLTSRGDVRAAGLARLAGLTERFEMGAARAAVWPADRAGSSLVPFDGARCPSRALSSGRP